MLAENEKICTITKVSCNKCIEVMLKKNLKTHMLRKHCKHTKGLINAQRYHDGVCIDKSAGIYLVADTLKGSDNPVHVQKSLIGRPTQVLNCESQGCEYLNTVAGISNKTI